jgi:SpoVK/Ycf46/Vps4 family AAA+-type ATPase
MASRELKLKVAEAVQDDVNKGIVRVDSTLMKQIAVSPGDIVEIEGKRKTVAIADRSYPGDLGLTIIRMDGITRRNAKASIGEVVAIRKIEVKEAKKVTIAPARKGIIVKASPQLFKQGLLGRVAVKGDIVSLGGTRSRRSAMSGNPFFEDMFNVLDESLMGFGFSDLKFVVAHTNPSKNPIIIAEDTEVEFNPEALEVKEEATIEVSYEDIGGLQEEIKKIREMVELPLKHPELFERLGIEAPKGVLLHGPPGTGKTLLAKAVASETNSGFLLINGPEIMCVAGDTEILTNPKGCVKAKQIFDDAKKSGRGKEEGSVEVVELKNPVSTYAYKDGKITKAHITHTTKLRAPSFKVELNDGNDVIVSQNQPFLVHRNGELVWKRLEDLKKGELVAKVNGIECEGKSYMIDFSLPDMIEKSNKFTLQSKNLSRSNWITLPKKTSPDLMEFVGLVMSDGHVDKREESITFANNELMLRERFKELVQTLFDCGMSEYEDGRVVVYSKLLVQYVMSLGIDSGKNRSIIPHYMYLLPKDEIRAFIRGYFDGNGCAAVTPFTTKNEKKVSYPSPIIYCQSKKFLAQLQSLMQLRLSISSVFHVHNTPKGKMYKLAIKGYDGRKKFIEIGSSGVKFEKLRQIEKNQKVKESENIPTPLSLIERIKEKLPYADYQSNDHYMYGKGKFTRYTLHKLFALAEKNGIVDERVLKEYSLLQRKDIGWLQIKSIEDVGEMELYDFTVDKDSFTTQNLLLLHNSKYYGQSEENLRKKFEDAQKNAPSIIFIDEIDAIASKREETRGEVERRVVAQLLSLMDGLQNRGKVIVLGATNRPNSLDPALRRPGRFDREIEIGVPSKEGRLDILKIHTRNMPLAKSVSLEQIAAITHGFVGADMSALTKEAAMVVLRRILPDIKLEEDQPISKEILEKLRVRMKDFKEALKIVRPSAMREVLVEVPNVSWEDIGGLEKVKRELREAVEWPLKHPKVFSRLGIRPPRGILLYGPPGTGKTLLAKAVAQESEANFILVNGPSLLSKWVGESEKAVREVFRKARQTAPTIIFFDEVDSIAPKRGAHSDSHVTERVVNQILTEMDGLQELHDVVVIAATNRPDMLDTALLRPGRFDRIILSPVPDEATRERIFAVHTQGMPLHTDVDIKHLSLHTKGYVGADIESVCREAAMIALRVDMATKIVKSEHFEEALKKVRPSVTEDIQRMYEQMRDYFTQARAREMDVKPQYLG